MKIYIQRSNNIFELIIRLFGVGLLLFFILQYTFERMYDLQFLSGMVLFASIVEIALLLMNKQVYNSGMLMVFSAYTILVHNGFVIANLIDNNYETFQSSLSMYFLKLEAYPKAIIIANIVLLIFVLSTYISTYNNTDDKEKLFSNQNDEGEKYVDYICIVLLLVETIYLFLFVYNNNLWFTGYLNTLKVIEKSSTYLHIVVLISLSIVFLLAGGTKKGIKIGLMLFGIISILHFSMGNRGEVFYSLVVCFAIYSIRFRTIKMKHVLLVCFTIIIIIPIIRFARNLELGIVKIKPLGLVLDVLAEEGIEISPFTYIVKYIQDGNSNAYGMTYIEAFLDFIYRRFGALSPFANIEQYSIKLIMPYNGMGFTMIAELYYNFGIVGASIIYIFFGQKIKNADNMIYKDDISANRRIFISMVMVEMINLTRNDCSTLPIYLTYSIILYMIYAFCRKLFTKKYEN